MPKANVTAVLTHPSRAIVAVGTADGFTYIWDYSAINDIASETTGGGGGGPSIALYVLAYP